MINYAEVTKENIKQHNPNWSEILHYWYKILIVSNSRSRKK